MASELPCGERAGVELSRVGLQPMDAAFHQGALFVACQGDGSVHVIDLATRRAAHRFDAGVGCETLAFFLRTAATFARMRNIRST
jgi:hypothetical protein